MKESIQDALKIHHLKDDDIVFVGDVDEIRNPQWKWEGFIDGKVVCKLKLLVYCYYLNQLSNEQFWGTIVGRYKNIKNKCLNDLRTNQNRLVGYEVIDYGWHFTSMHHQLERKLKDSYTEESYATKEVMNNLQDNIKNSKDFLGRDFTYKVDESQWPKWLEENRERYLHLLK